jgi:hypothetical protein
LREVGPEEQGKVNEGSALELQDIANTRAGDYGHGPDVAACDVPYERSSVYQDVLTIHSQKRLFPTYGINIPYLH